MSHDCATVNQYHNAILQFIGVLSLFTTGSNTTALPDNAGGIVASVAGGLIGGGGLILLTLGVCILILRVDHRIRRGWCMCMFCTCNC